MTILCDLARKYETDKGGRHLRYGGGDSDTCHNYTPYYHQLFEEDRMEVKHVLEIGINSGASLRMWKEYFPNAEIVGIDSNGECMRHSEKRISCFPADQNNAAQLINVMKQIQGRPRFDLIIDDGSHERPHQVTSMVTLLPFLSDWGYYVVEDLGPHFQSWSLSSKLPLGYDWKDEPIYGGIGKAACTEHLFVIKREALCGSL